MLEKIARQKRNRGILYVTLGFLGGGALLFLILYAARDNVPPQQRFRVYVPSIALLILLTLGSLVYLIWWTGQRDNTDRTMRTLSREERVHLERQIYPQIRGNTPLARKVFLSDRYLIPRYTLYQRMIPLNDMEELSVIAKRKLWFGRRRWALRLEILCYDGQRFTVRTPWAQNVAKFVAAAAPHVEILRFQESAL